MRLAGFGIYSYDLPFTEALTLKGATLHSREGLLLRIIGDDGSEGWGEAAPLPGFSRETLDEVADQLLEVSEEMPRTGRSPSGNRPDILPPSTAPCVRFAVELAVGNLSAARRGISPLELLDPDAADHLWISGLLSGPREKAIEEAARMREAGYCSVKLKVGGRTVEEDARLVHTVRETLGEGIALRLDANRAWSFEEAEEFARSTAGLRYEYVEEPLADPGGLAELAAKHGLPVALDESLVDIAPESLENHGYAVAVVLKPTLLGGITHTLRVSERARKLGITPVISSAYESGVGVRGLIPLSAATGGAPAGLDTYRRLAADVLAPPLDLNVPQIGVRAMLRAAREVDLDRLETVAEL